MKAPVIGLIVNKNSAGFKDLFPHLKHYERLKGSRFMVRFTTKKAELSELASEFLDARIEVLAVAGGDGTLHAVINALLPFYGEATFPHILIIKAGTINNMTSELKMKGSGLRILRELMTGRDEITVKTVNRRILHVNSECGFLYGSGFPVLFLERYYGAKRQGILTALSIICSSIFYAAFFPESKRELFQRQRARITIDEGIKEEGEFIFIIASTILKIGLNFSPCYLALSRSNTFHIIGSSSSLRDILLKLWRIYMGRPLLIDGSMDYLASEVSIELDRPSPYMVDGEIKMPSKRHIIRIGRELSFIVDLEKR